QERRYQPPPTTQPAQVARRVSEAGWWRPQVAWLAGVKGRIAQLFSASWCVQPGYETLSSFGCRTSKSVLDAVVLNYD
ncbi:hypothetical protein Hamer_G003247, partial [Homarus americanus]